MNGQQRAFYLGLRRLVRSSSTSASPRALSWWRRRQTWPYVHQQRAWGRPWPPRRVCAHWPHNDSARVGTRRRRQRGCGRAVAESQASTGAAPSTPQPAAAQPPPPTPGRSQRTRKSILIAAVARAVSRRCRSTTWHFVLAARDTSSPAQR